MDSAGAAAVQAHMRPRHPPGSGPLAAGAAAACLWAATAAAQAPPPALTLTPLAPPTTAGPLAVQAATDAPGPSALGFLLTRSGPCPAVWPPTATKPQKIAARVAFPALQVLTPFAGPRAIRVDVRVPGPLIACGYLFAEPGPPGGALLAAAALESTVIGAAPSRLTAEVRGLGPRAAVVRATISIDTLARPSAFSAPPPGRCRFVPDNRRAFGAPARPVLGRRTTPLFGPRARHRPSICGASLPRGDSVRARPWTVSYVPADGSWRPAREIVRVPGLAR